jgi:hypothetical protein
MSNDLTQSYQFFIEYLSEMLAEENSHAEISKSNSNLMLNLVPSLHLRDLKNKLEL